MMESQRPWSSWWTCWTSHSRCQEPPPTSAIPITASRSVPKMSGLFDRGVTGVADSKVASVLTDQSADHLTTIDHHSSLFSEADLSLVDDQMLQASVSEAGDLDDLAFCEGFTDLADYLQGNEVEMDQDTVFLPNPAPLTKTRGRKRTATESILLSFETTEAGPSSPIIDHNDYTLKASKRVRLTTDASESDAESIISSVSSSAVFKTPREKYTERRSKNNVASRRSRESRKQKYVNMEDEAERLQKRNKELEEQVTKLEAMTQQMKAILIQRMSQK